MSQSVVPDEDWNTDPQLTSAATINQNQSLKAGLGLPANKPSSTNSGLNSIELSSHKELNQLVKDFLDEYAQGIAYQQKPVVSPIEIDELSSKLAKVYEKVRRIVDWKEENLIRRTAIERILKRTLLSELSGIGQGGLDAEKITGPLIQEMVRSGYFSGQPISKNLIPVAERSLSKYIFILNNSPYVKNKSLQTQLNNLDKKTKKKHRANLKEKVNFYNWILEIAACELEEILEPSFKENALINFMTSSIYNKLRVVPQGKMSDEEILIQTYVAVHRTLFSLDAPIIAYNLIKYHYPGWFEENPEFIESFANDISQVRQKIEQDLEHPHGKEFFKICARMDAAYLIFGDVMKEIENEPEQIEQKLKDKKNLTELITQVYQKRLATLRSRLYRSAIYSTLSIFVAGITSLMIIEGPVAELMGTGFSWFAVFVDLAVPSSLMFILVITIQPPKADNLERVKQEIYKIIYQNDEKDEYEVSLINQRNKFLNALFSGLSVLGGLIGAYAVFSIFRLAGIPWTSLYIDTIYVALVMFAATVIRHKAQELTIQESGGFLTMIIDFFYLPLARVGQYLSKKWKEYNIVSVFLTALVDTPFSMLLALIEDWRSFLRDRRSEIH